MVKLAVPPYGKLRGAFGSCGREFQMTDDAEPHRNFAARRNIFEPDPIVPTREAQSFTTLKPGQTGDRRDHWISGELIYQNIRRSMG